VDLTLRPVRAWLTARAPRPLVDQVFGMDVAVDDTRSSRGRPRSDGDAIAQESQTERAVGQLGYKV
jgi:hypothetical protein